VIVHFQTERPWDFCPSSKAKSHNRFRQRERIFVLNSKEIEVFALRPILRIQIIHSALKKSLPLVKKLPYYLQHTLKNGKFRGSGGQYDRRILEIPLSAEGIFSDLLTKKNESKLH